jgi:hypothetical protein
MKPCLDVWCFVVPHLMAEFTHTCRVLWRVCTSRLALPTFWQKKKCCQYLRSDPCTRGSNVFRHIHIYCLFSSSSQQVIWLYCGFCTVAYVYASRFMSCKAGIFICCISLVSLAGWRLGYWFGQTGFDFREGQRFVLTNWTYRLWGPTNCITLLLPRGGWHFCGRKVHEGGC